MFNATQITYNRIQNTLSHAILRKKVLSPVNHIRKLFFLMEYPIRFRCEGLAIKFVYCDERSHRELR